MRAFTAQGYDRALRIGFTISIVGWLIVAAGFVLSSKSIIRAGTGFFLYGIVVWGFVNGGAFLWGFARAVRKTGFRKFFAAPRWAALYIALMLFLLSVGGMLLWGVVRVAVLRR